jgi:hypothetical protein
VLPSRASPLPQESGCALIAGHFHSQIKNNRGGQHIFSVGAGLARDAGTALYLEERCAAIASKPAPTREWFHSYSGSLHSQIKSNRGGQHIFFVGAGLARDAGTAFYLEERSAAIASKPAPTREWLGSYSGSLSQPDQKQSRRPTYFLSGSRACPRCRHRVLSGGTMCCHREQARSHKRVVSLL